MKVGLMGRSKMLADTIQLINQHPEHEVAFIWTSKAEDYYNCDATEFESLAQKKGCPYIYAPSVKDITSVPFADVVISVNFVNIIPQFFLDRFEYGVLNAHAGDLPRYRGNACPNWAIINNEAHVTLTVHEMSADLDAGPIYTQSEYALSHNTYISDVYAWLYQEAPLLFMKAIEHIEQGIKPTPQKGRAFRAFPRKPEDARLDFSQGIDWNYRLIRASSDPFSGAFCCLESEDQKVIIRRAEPAALDYDFCAVDGQLLFCDQASLSFTISSQNQALTIQKFNINGLSQQQSFELICGSMRNRLK